MAAVLMKLTLIHSSFVAQRLQRGYIAIRHISSPAEEHQSTGSFSQGPPEHLDPASSPDKQDQTNQKLPPVSQTRLKSSP